MLDKLARHIYIERFAEDNYEEFVEINFKQTPFAAEIFSGDLTVENMVMALRFRFPKKKILSDKTLHPVNDWSWNGSNF